MSVRFSDTPFGTLQDRRRAAEHGHHPPYREAVRVETPDDDLPCVVNPVGHRVACAGHIEWGEDVAGIDVADPNPVRQTESAVPAGEVRP